MRRPVLISSLVLCLIVSFGVSRGVFADSKTLQKGVAEEFERHNYQKVIEIYRGYVDQNPDLLVPLAVKVRYSQSLADTGQIDEAILALQEVLGELVPPVDPLKLQYDLANLLFLQRRYDEAKIIYQKILFQSTRNADLVAKVRERVGFMKKREGRKKDMAVLQILDIETALESGEVPDGAETILQEIQKDQKPGAPQAERVQALLTRVREMRTEKAKALLDEARRLFDEKRNFTAVREILNQLTRNYSDVAEMKSVEALAKSLLARRRDSVPAPESIDQP